jgi:hypothetical protein
VFVKIFLGVVDVLNGIVDIVEVHERRRPVRGLGIYESLLSMRDDFFSVVFATEYSLKLSALTAANAKINAPYNPYLVHAFFSTDWDRRKCPGIEAIGIAQRTSVA